MAAAVPPVASTSSTISTRSPGLDRVAVDLEQVGAVLELVLLALDLPRQLARLADRDERRRRAGRRPARRAMKPRASMPSTRSIAGAGEVRRRGRRP